MIFSIHYFLFSFAQSGIWSYTFVYAKYYANATNVQYGILAMIFPTVNFFVKPTACSLADARAIHKSLLLCSLAVFALSYGSLAVLPFFKDLHDRSTDFVAWLLICVAMIIGSMSCACIFCMNDALGSNYARKHNKSYGIMRSFASGGYACGALVIMLIGDVPWLPFRVPGIICLVATIVVDMVVLLLWPYNEDFEMFHDGSTIEQRKLSIVGPNTAAFLASNANRPRGSISRDVLQRIKAGRSKSVGGVPRTEQQAIQAILQQQEQQQQFGHHLGVNLSIGVAVDQLKDLQVKKHDSTENQNEHEEECLKEYSNFQCQMILLKMIGSKHKSFIRYIALFTLFGIAQAMVWNFQFDFLRARVVKDDSEFEFISTLTLVMQAVLGDVAWSFVAADLLRIFGANANMSLALITIGLRCFVYGNILAYGGLPALVVAECLQGPSLGLYWILIVEIGSHYALMVTDFMPELKRRGIVRSARQEAELNGCLRATMIGVMSASTEGLGVALGSLIGGLVSASASYESMWNFCAAIGFVAGFLNIGYDIITKLFINRRETGETSSNDDDSSGENSSSPPPTSNQIPTVIIDKVNTPVSSRL